MCTDEKWKRGTPSSSPPSLRRGGREGGSGEAGGAGRGGAPTLTRSGDPDGAPRGQDAAPEGLPLVAPAAAADAPRPGPSGAAAADAAGKSRLRGGGLGAGGRRLEKFVGVTCVAMEAEQPRWQLRLRAREDPTVVAGPQT